MFRLAAPADLETMLAFMRELNAYEDIHFDEPVVRRALSELLVDNRVGRAWFICEGDNPVGYVVLTFGYSIEFHGRTGLIDELYLRESHRRSGWGTEALNFVEKFARDLGIDAVQLENSHHNVGAQSFYSKRGYKRHDRYLLTKWLDGIQHPGW